MLEEHFDLTPERIKEPLCLMAGSSAAALWFFSVTKNTVLFCAFEVLVLGFCIDDLFAEFFPILVFSW